MTVTEHLKSVSFSMLTAEEIQKLSVFDARKLLDQKEDLKTVLQDSRLGGSGPHSYCGVCNLRGGECYGHESFVDLALPVLNPGAKNLFKLFIRDYCFVCNSYNTEVKKKCTKCKEIKPKLTYTNPYTFYSSKKFQDVIRVDVLYENLKKIPKQEVESFFKNSESTVDSFFITNLVLPSVTIRPNVFFQERLYEDDLTRKLETILQVNQKLKQMIKLDPFKQRAGLNQMYKLLQYHVFTYFNNKSPRIPTAVYKNGVALKSLLEKIESKSGLFRGSLSGKRTDFAMRAVLSGDSTLNIDEVGIPKALAVLLTKPVVIDASNIDAAKTWVNSAEYVKASYYEYRTEEGSFLKLKITDANKQFITNNLTIGSVIHRSLMTGDWVVFNRQPTLHRYGLMAHKLIVYDDSKNEGNTIRIPPAICAPYNADFDGDEGNLMPPKSKEAEIDMALLMNVKANIIDTKKGNPLVGLTKQTLTAACGLSLTKKRFKKHVVVDLFDRYYEDLDPKKQEYTGRDILSELFPKNFSYKQLRENGLEIKDGKFIKGVITKRNFSNTSAIMSQLTSYLGGDFWRALLKMLQVFRSYYKYLKHSISYCDYAKFLNRQKSDIEDMNAFQVSKIEEINNTFQSLSLDQKISNPVLLMTQAGSSGSLITITQLTKAVGVKRIRGFEIGEFFKDCYPEYLDSQRELVIIKKGYITSNYATGLSFPEYVNDAIHARDTNLDNQLNVSTLGYFNRRITNAFIDLVAVKDGFLEDGSKNIIQYRFGGCGADLINYKPNAVSAPLVRKIDELSAQQTNDHKVVTAANIKTVLKNTYKQNSNITNVILSSFKPHHELTIPQLIQLGEYITTPIGDPLGVTAAHAFAEPSTQMTLSAKHDVSGHQTRFTRLLELTERTLTRPKIKVTLPDKQQLKKIISHVSEKKLGDLYTIHSMIETNQIIVTGNLKTLTTKTLNSIKSVLKDFTFDKVKESKKKAVTALLFTAVDMNKNDLYKIYLRLKNLQITANRADILKISDKEYYLVGNKGSSNIITLAKELKTITNRPLSIEYFDPIYYAKCYGVEAGRKILYQQFSKFATEGLDIDPRYFSLFCDLVTNKGILLALGRNGVINHKPPLAKLCYEAAKSGVFELAFSNKKDYLQNPYSCLITNKPIKIGADYFEIYL